MPMPGFAAEASLYKTSQQYRHRTLSSMRGDALVPALFITYCRNPRPGLLIPNTICADCAVYEVVCLPRIGCLYWPVSPEEPECWNEAEA
jgi:hypothetical protein